MNRNEVGRLYEQHARTLMAYSCGLLGSWELAQDVVHAVFCNLLRETQAVAEFLPYLFRSVRNMTFNVQRDSARVTLLENEPNWFETDHEDVELALIVQDALRTLPAQQREVILLHIWCGMTFAEIGYLIEIPQNTASSRYHYAIEKLKPLLRNAEVSDERH